MTSGGRRVLGFVGLGRMGMPMARRLSDVGHEVIGYDLSTEVRRRFPIDAGGHAVEALGELARCELLLLMLPDSTSVVSVLGQLKEAGALRQGMTVIDMSSSAPSTTRELSSDLAAQGVLLVDAPVSGGVLGAENGNLTVMVGADPETFLRLAPLFQVFGKVVHAGPVGAGHAVKALNNLLSATHLLATCEAMRVGEQFGLNPGTMLSIFNSSSGRSGSTEIKLPKYILPGTFNSGFSLSLMLKDMRLANDLATQMQQTTLLAVEATRLWALASESLPASADHTEIARWSELGEWDPAERTND